VKKLRFIQPIPRFNKSLESITSKLNIKPNVIYEKLKVLCDSPELGLLIPRTKALRKYRTSLPPYILKRRLRFIYYVTEEGIIPLDIYYKGDRDDLSAADIKAIRRQLEDYLKGS
jgi:hypothetical protein